MRLKILSSAAEDLYDSRIFYEKQGAGIGEYFFDSLFSDIDSLILYAGIHPKVFGYLSTFVQTVPLRGLLHT